MEYQKTINVSDNKRNESSKFRARNCFEINDESQRTYNESNQVKFKTSLIRSNLFDYSDAYILAKETMTVTNTVAQSAAAINRNKG